MRAFVWALLAAIVLASCATPYQRLGKQGGYLEERLAEDEYEVSFVANAYTGREVLYDFALLRAAEIGSRLGFSHLAVLGQRDPSLRNRFEVTSTSKTRQVTAEGDEVSTETETTSSGKAPPEIVLRVRYFEGPPTERYLEVNEVQQTLRSLAKRHGLDLATQ